ncbi:transposase [Gluconacetobacter sacchari DSM 12717]|uniref:DDE-type integrase/transposase/recombinase n=2 Tax=Gluconacetobacter sacchari TaxID=92759 RepID=A0A7W4IH70_9PROT|nr:Mu transposase C-terminal domain-containing protein [Gluconacetobacter sacchari]MBB2162694.1 DDE-type integrase/transposase/recombinase [Gluconacetobacter sacchari]GBQ28874.1 transposase [Gluconacetobacter sacchari DSM 12717]
MKPSSRTCIPSSHTSQDAAWQEAVRRSEVLRPLAESQERSAAAVASAAARLGLSIPQTYRLLRKFRSEMQSSALLCQTRGPRRGSARVAPVVERLIEEAIEKEYLRREKPTLKKAYRHLRQACLAIDRKPPCLNTLRARVVAYDGKKAMTRREGSKAAGQVFRPVSGRLETTRPLEIVQIDHTKVDLMLVDDVTRASIGRPWLTLVLDVYTRMVMGFLLSLEAPGATSVALALAHAVLPKGRWLAERSITVEWPAEGLPSCIHVDNGAEFHSRAFERGCAQHGVEIVYRPPGTPRYGGHIERLMGTLMKRVQALPGTTFSNVGAKGDYASEARACLSFREFERILGLEILGSYHHEVHRGIGVPPIVLWTKGTESGPKRRPFDEHGLVLDFLPYEERLVRRDGVRLFNIQYQDGTLAHLLDQAPGRLRVKYDPRDLSAVFVELPGGDHVRVPYADLRRGPITLWEHREAVRRLRAEGQRVVNEFAIFATIQAQRAALDEAQNKTRRARRMAVRRRLAHPENAGDRPSVFGCRDEVGDGDDADIPLPPPGANSGVEIW